MTETEDVSDQAPVQQEKMLAQSEVNGLIGKAKHEAAERARRETEALYNQKLADQQAQTLPPPAAQNPGVQDVESLKSDLMDQFRGEMEDQKRLQEESYRRQEAEKLAADYQGKLAAAKERYEDFDEVVGQLNPQEFVDVIMIANEVEGTADVMYELAKNPDKLMRIKSAATLSPTQAKRMMSDMAASIKQNSDALESKQSINEPLPRVKPSLAGTQAGQYSSIQDFKNADWLKG